MERNIAQVMDEILAEVPASHTRMESLKGSFRAIKVSASYTAPELMMERWITLQRTLNDHFPAHITSQDWVIKIWSIFSTMPVEDIRKEMKRISEQENKNV